MMVQEIWYGNNSIRWVNNALWEPNCKNFESFCTTFDRGIVYSGDLQPMCRELVNGRNGQQFWDDINKFKIEE